MKIKTDFYQGCLERVRQKEIIIQLKAKKKE